MTTTSLVPRVGDLDIAAYAPLVHLFPYSGPVYDPSSVDWWLGPNGLAPRVTLTRPDHSTYTPSGSDAFDESLLPAAPQGSYIGLIDPTASSPVRAGDRSTAVAYVHQRPAPGGATDLQYWLFYPVRGLSTARVIVESLGAFKVGAEFDVDLLAPQTGLAYQGVGEHQGDWKHVTVRVDPEGRIIGV